MTKKQLIATTALAGVYFLNSAGAFAQDPASQAGFDEDIKLLRKDLRSAKKQIIAANMDLTEAEAQQFWPIYDRYMIEISKASDPKYSLLKDYAQNYSSMTGEQADNYINGRAAVEDSVIFGQARIGMMRSCTAPVVRASCSPTYTLTSVRMPNSGR